MVSGLGPGFGFSGPTLSMMVSSQLEPELGPANAASEPSLRVRAKWGKPSKLSMDGCVDDGWVDDR